MCLTGLPWDVFWWCPVQETNKTNVSHYCQHSKQISINNKHLKPGISPTFDQLQSIPLTQTRCHDNFSSKILSMSSPSPNTFSWLPICCQDVEAPFQLSDWTSKCIAHYNFPLLIIIPGIHSLAYFMTTRSLIILINPCSILLKFIFSHIATLYLFYHLTSTFISYAPYAKASST